MLKARYRDDVTMCDFSYIWLRNICKVALSVLPPVHTARILQLWTKETIKRYGEAGAHPHTSGVGSPVCILTPVSVGRFQNNWF